ncbi:LLM class F420-dependent oxidoreductase [Streptomyces californicus]
MSTTWYDPVATLSYLAGVTERVRLMSHVAVVGLRHPLITAKQYATLDHLSGGRLILGVGAGHVREEFEAVGADFDGRGGVLDETVDALRAALGPDEYPEFAGERFLLQRARAAPPAGPGAGPDLAGRLLARRHAPRRRPGRWLPQGDPRDRLPGADRPGARPAGAGGRGGADRHWRDHRTAVRR